MVVLTSVSFVVYGEAAPRGSKIVGHTKGGRAFVRDSAKKSYPWMRDVKQAAGIAMLTQGPRFHEKLLQGPLGLDLRFYRPRPKNHYGTGRNAGVLKASAPARPISAPDTGKLARGTVDALKGIVLRDDSQIVDERHQKFYGEPARCEIRIWELPAELARVRHVPALTAPGVAGERGRRADESSDGDEDGDGLAHQEILSLGD